MVAGAQSALQTFGGNDAAAAGGAAAADTVGGWTTPGEPIANDGYLARGNEGMGSHDCTDAAGPGP